MSRFRFNKIKWDKIISAVVVVVLLVGCVAGLATIFNTKTTDVSDFNFKKGALDSAGFYIESDTSIYTKDLIECQGLVIEPDFEATGEYQVFYYDTNKNFVGSTEVLDAHLDGIYEKGDTFSFAKYCRIVISPATPTDEDGYPVDDWKIRFWEVTGYADDYKITVNKKQKEVAEALTYKVYGTNVAFHNADLNKVGMTFSGPQAYEGYDMLELDVKGLTEIAMTQTEPESLAYKFVDADNTVVFDGAYTADSSVTISVPANAVTLYISVNQTGTYLFSGK